MESLSRVLSAWLLVAMVGLLVVWLVVVVPLLFILRYLLPVLVLAALFWFLISHSLPL